MQTKSIALIFDKGLPTTSATMHRLAPLAPALAAMCIHLTGANYKEYIDRITTRDFGGILPTFIARVARQIFPYKSFTPLNYADEPLDIMIPQSANTNVTPEIGNSAVQSIKWSATEIDQMQTIMRAHARWMVDPANSYVKAVDCAGTTLNATAICDQCDALSRDESLKRSIRRVSSKCSGNLRFVF